MKTIYFSNMKIGSPYSGRSIGFWMLPRSCDLGWTLFIYALFNDLHSWGIVLL